MVRSRVDGFPLLRDKVGEENDQRGLGEFGRLQRPDAFQAEPAMRFAVQKKDQQLQKQHHAERSECPAGTLQHAIIAPLEEHESDEGNRRPDQLVTSVVKAGIDVGIELRHHRRGAVNHHQAGAHHRDHGSKQQPIGFQLLRHYPFLLRQRVHQILKHAAAVLEIFELIEACARGRKQHRVSPGMAERDGFVDRGCERSALNNGPGVFTQLSGDFRSRCANQ